MENKNMEMTEKEMERFIALRLELYRELGKDCQNRDGRTWALAITDFSWTALMIKAIAEVPSLEAKVLLSFFNWFVFGLVFLLFVKWVLYHCEAARKMDEIVDSINALNPNSSFSYMIPVKRFTGLYTADKSDPLVVRMFSRIPSTSFLAWGMMVVLLINISIFAFCLAKYFQVV